ncbi:MAG: family 16 glycosylhydrolase [Saprospiraceae bacterium]|nr:family 16 glycosylhydrolase [Saprospiraceae bacterium]MBK6565601.1 family 16 glycosylhydrolase [Saprospiraceae bacterium]MBK7523114.1 family 16 glycosylhydrolase [Saprospiraceae bacterium]MBK8081972.1 family 16 glycosylhydrolase [Saprospiraceae bacterium]MBK8370507.1 family 16 glycosylhydrolase [Saprospiraceae bacterium]
MQLNKYTLISLCALLFSILCIQTGCEDPDGTPDKLDLPVLTTSDLNLKEDDVDQNFSLELNLTGDNKTNAVVSFSVISGSAFKDTDFKVTTAGKIVFAPGETKKTIEIVLLGDEVIEAKKTFTVKLYNPINMTLAKDVVLVTLEDDDDNTQGLIIPEKGYTTPLQYEGYKLAWADEFDSTALNPNNWVYETGAGGWGNDELQHYREENVSLTEGKLVITAKQQKFGSSNYTSSRIKTQGKKSFKFGRIDIRAALPEGKGLWPALWMLGTNITSVGWPNCGEIDIMELTGDLPNRVLGTVHFGQSFAERQKSSNSKYLSGNNNFQDEFHVFSLIWKENLIEFYVDDEKYHTITPANTGAVPYPFNKNFFFIMNVAVGGNLPGSPDASTPFPQSMIVDYIRVFQPM